ncbi:hypothetical protein [Pseudomonas sp.]|uniref:hypothetical protein n=1 Tax=Pseudomonas sp. TaxID=306 RepID=UPI003CC65074
MAIKLEIVVGYVGDGVGGAAGATAVVEQFNSDKQGFALVNQHAQTGAAVANVLSIVSVMGGFVPFLNIATNTFAGTTTFLKITAEYQDTRQFSVGDVISLVGNVAGTAAAFTFLAGFGPASLGFTAVAVGASALGLVTCDTARMIHDAVIAPIAQKYFADVPHGGYPDHWVAPNLLLVPRLVIDTEHGGMVAAIRWDPSTGATSLGSLHLLYPSGSPAGGGGGPGFAIGAVPVGSAPAVPGGHDNIEISIESINGDRSKGQAPIPHPAAPQDVYACCTGSQDSYS